MPCSPTAVCNPSSRTVFDVKACGASGVETATADDTQCIQNALNAAATPSARSRVVWVPRGTYVLRGSLRIPSNVHLVGEGRASVLKFGARVPATTKMIMNAGRTNGNSGIALENVTLDGNRANNSALGLTAVDWTHVTQSCIRACRVTGFTQHCFDLSGANNDNLIADNHLEDFGTSIVGFGVVVLQDCHRNRIEGNRVVSAIGSGTYGIMIAALQLPAQSPGSLLEH